MPWSEEQVRDQVVRVEAQLSALSSRQGPVSGAQALESVEALVALYGECLGRMLRCVEQSGHHELAESFAGDELISHMLLVHDLHPVDVEARVESALEEVRQAFGAGGGAIELLGVTGASARVRFEVEGCRSTVTRLRQAVEEAVAQAAPEIQNVEAEEAMSQSTAVIPAESLFSGGHVPEAG